MSEWDEATKATAKHADDIALLGAGVGAAILRLAIYSGPPRPIGAAAIDSVVMCAVGLERRGLDNTRIIPSSILILFLA